MASPSWLVRKFQAILPGAGRVSVQRRTSNDPILDWGDDAEKSTGFEAAVCAACAVSQTETRLWKKERFFHESISQMMDWKN